jgi:chemotaxis protein methyltransferase CheR
MSALVKDDGELGSLVEYAKEIVTKASGNVFTDQHSFLIETKIRKRMMDLNILDVSTYQKYVNENSTAEHDYLISELTTHYTFFFREFRHFEYLQLNLPKIVQDVRDRGGNEIKILCLACSRGQEPYSLAMFFDYHLSQMGVTDIKVSILGTDVDKASVEIANNGVYRFNDIKTIPMKYLANHWARGKDDIKNYVKVKKDLKSKCHFRYGNLLELKKELTTKYDIIFCRNVFIYFDEDQIKKICKDILEHLQPKGLFFTGVSESLTTLKLPIKVHGASIYTHDTVEEEVTASSLPAAEKAASVVHQQSFVELPDPLKVLCVDDSKVILSLMKKIFGSMPGYEVVGTAENGVEAEEFLKNNDVDVMTLDIHMPVMDGLSYLKKNYNDKHPPVVIVSSVSREDAFKAMEGLKLGASDYIEKPSLDNFMIKGDEICTKLRVAALEKLTGPVRPVYSDIAKEFGSTELTNPEQYFYNIYGHYTDKKKIHHVVKELNQDTSWPATFLMLEGCGNVLDDMINEFKTDLPLIKVEKFDPNNITNTANTLFIGDFKDHFSFVNTTLATKKSSTIVLGHHSDNAADLFLKMKIKNLLLDDVNFIQASKHSKLQDLAIDSGPFTSFAYQAKHFLLKDE